MDWQSSVQPVSEGEQARTHAMSSPHDVPASHAASASQQLASMQAEQVALLLQIREPQTPPPPLPPVEVPPPLPHAGSRSAATIDNAVKIPARMLPPPATGATAAPGQNTTGGTARRRPSFPTVSVSSRSRLDQPPQAEAQVVPRQVVKAVKSVLVAQPAPVGAPRHALQALSARQASYESQQPAVPAWLRQ